MSNGPKSDDERRARRKRALWATLADLHRGRRLIVGTTAVAAILSVLVSLILPNWYRAETRLLLPTRSSAGLLSAALLDNLPSAARTVIGGRGGDYFRFLTVLTSRTMSERVVGVFDLVEVYDVAGHRTPTEEAIRRLGRNVDFTVDERYEFLRVAVLDKEPRRAADMANFFVEELERMNAELASRSAGRFRSFVERRHDETLAALDSIQDLIRSFQESHGVLDLAIQGEQFFAYLAELRLQSLEAEVRYEALLAQLGAENSVVRSARETVQAARRKYEDALAGRERLLPIPAGELPRAQSEYLELERERLILGTLLQFVRPVLEEARFDEQRSVEAVQVVDVAVPPGRKAKPRRSVICVVATLSAFLLASLFALAWAWWDRNHAALAGQLGRVLDASGSGADPGAGASP